MMARPLLARVGIERLRRKRLGPLAGLVAFALLPRGDASGPSPGKTVPNPGGPGPP